MKDYQRSYPLFSLCGLNCGLCPRYHTEGESKCPGCGGPDFHLKHPTCAVITCSMKHGSIEYCFQCAAYPCDKYRRPSEKDSFISYQKVLTDQALAKQEGIDHYKKVLDEKVAILELLLDQYNDGRRKGLYCLAVNLLSIEDLRQAVLEIKSKVGGHDLTMVEKAVEAVAVLKIKAAEKNIELKLRK